MRSAGSSTGSANGWGRMAMPRSNWTDAYQCYACGMKFRSYAADARHRHNWPALCKRNKQFAAHMAKYFPPKETPDGKDNQPESAGPDRG